MDQASLPRAPWRGRQIRYQGIDILRFEGVPEEDLPDKIVRLETATKPTAKPRKTAQTRTRRIKVTNLPK